VLQYLPTNHPDRPRFEQLFKDMFRKILICQQADGLWRASLPTRIAIRSRKLAAPAFTPTRWHGA